MHASAHTLMLYASSLRIIHRLKNSNVADSRLPFSRVFAATSMTRTDYARREGRRRVGLEALCARP